MAEESPQSNSPPPPAGRRSSFAGQTFADLFGTGRSSVSRTSTDGGNNSPPQQLPGPISQAAAQAQRRRLSLTTLGLSGSPNGSPFGSSFRGRGDSIGSANSGSIDESAIAEDDAAPMSNNAGSTPATPFARRTSFGARALRDIRTSSFSGQAGGGGGGGAGSPTAQNGPSGEGFNWSDNLRNRAERTSIAGQGGVGPIGSMAGGHNRAKSVAVMEPPPPAQMPKPKERARPDHFQERILKGDFYMD